MLFICLRAAFPVPASCPGRQIGFNGGSSALRALPRKRTTYLSMYNSLPERQPLLDAEASGASPKLSYVHQLVTRTLTFNRIPPLLLNWHSFISTISSSGPVLRLANLGLHCPGTSLTTFYPFEDDIAPLTCCGGCPYIQSQTADRNNPVTRY